MQLSIWLHLTVDFEILLIMVFNSLGELHPNQNWAYILCAIQKLPTLFFFFLKSNISILKQIVW